MRQSIFHRCLKESEKRGITLTINQGHGTHGQGSAQICDLFMGIIRMFSSVKKSIRGRNIGNIAS
jgi:hypothetical protein